MNRLTQAWIFGADEEIEALRKEFVSRYGEKPLQKLFEFILDTSSMSLTGGFTEDGLLYVVENIHLWLGLFAANWEAEQEKAKIRVLMKMRKDGKASFWVEEGKDSTVSF